MAWYTARKQKDCRECGNYKKLKNGTEKCRWLGILQEPHMSWPHCSFWKAIPKAKKQTRRRSSGSVQKESEVKN